MKEVEGIVGFCKVIINFYIQYGGGGREYGGGGRICLSSDTISEVDFKPNSILQNWLVR